MRQIGPVFGHEGETTSVSGNSLPVTADYDALYRTNALTDGDNHQTQYTFTPTGNLSQITYPGGDTLLATAWDNNGNVLTAIHGRGQTIQYSYNDPASQLTDITYPSTPALNVHLTYDAYGRTASVSDATGSKLIPLDWTPTMATSPF